MNKITQKVINGVQKVIKGFQKVINGYIISVFADAETESPSKFILLLFSPQNQFILS